MLHQILKLTRPLIVVDTETTGVDHKNDRIVELGFQLWTADGMTKEWRSLINPGIPIPPRVTKVHGITDADMRLCQLCKLSKDTHPTATCAEFHVVPTFAQLAPHLVRGFVDCDYAGKNVRFDLRILSAEFKRVKVEWGYAGARIVDIDRLEAIAHPRDLSTLHAKYVGLPHDGAHGALADVRASATVITKQLETHAVLPRDLDQLHALQWEGWIDSEGLFRVIDGVPCFGRWGKHAYRPMKDVPVGYYDFILSNDFSAEVKMIAAEAKLGRYPEVKK